MRTIAMRFGARVRLRLRSVFARTKVDQELDEELQYHLERQMQEDIAAGMSRNDTRRALQGFQQRKEECRDMRQLNLIDNLAQDVRFAVRQLRKNPGFSSAAVLMLALGMCASVAIFAFVDAALIKPLPYRNPARLLSVFETTRQCPECTVSYLDYLDWKKLNTVFRSMDASTYTGFMLGTREGAQAAYGFRVTDGFFRTLGVTPALGRDFNVGEDSATAPRTVILSYGAWQRRYGGKPDVLGKTVTLNGEPNVIIGVLPREFHFASSVAEFWTSLHVDGGCERRRSCHNMHVVARLSDGVANQAASANMKLIALQLQKQYPASNRGQGAGVVALSATMSGGLRPTLLALLGGAGLLLLIASVNIVSLLLVRCESRKREISVRRALGASQGRITRQFAAEGLVLVSAGSALGLALAYWTIHILATLIPSDMMTWMPFLIGIGLNVRVLGLAGGIALSAAALFAVTPALHSSLSKMREGLAEGSRGSAGKTWRSVGSKLVVLELATAVVLLAGAGLCGKSLYYLLHVNLGMQPEHVVTLQFAAPDSYGDDEKGIALERDIVSRIESLPGVKSIGLTSNLPVSSWDGATWLRVVGHPLQGAHNEVPERQVSSGYFPAIGAKLTRGRYFTRAEDVSKPKVAIINQAFAKQYFAGENPIGKQLTYEIAVPQVPLEIIGVVEDIKEGQLDTASRPTMYVPFVMYTSSYFNVVVRTANNERPVLAALASAIHRIDPDISTKSPTTMSEVINASQSAYLHQSAAWLAGGFASLALLLSVAGLYGVVAYSVNQRTREVGIRMALGADRGSVYRLILKEAGWLTTGGIAIGLGCSVAAATLMRGLLFGVQSWDLPTLAAVALVLGAAAILASYIPARRAASVNPVEALRAE